MHMHLAAAAINVRYRDTCVAQVHQLTVRRRTFCERVNLNALPDSKLRFTRLGLGHRPWAYRPRDLQRRARRHRITDAVPELNHPPHPRTHAWVLVYLAAWAPDCLNKPWHRVDTDVGESGCRATQVGTAVVQ